MTKVVLKVVSLVLQGVETLILDFPPTPSRLHEIPNDPGCHGLVCDPRVLITDFSLFVDQLIGEPIYGHDTVPAQGYTVAEFVNMAATARVNLLEMADSSSFSQTAQILIHGFVV